MVFREWRCSPLPPLLACSQINAEEGQDQAIVANGECLVAFDPDRPGPRYSCNRYGGSPSFDRDAVCFDDHPFPFALCIQDRQSIARQGDGSIDHDGAFLISAGMDDDPVAGACNIQGTANGGIGLARSDMQGPGRSRPGEQEDQGEKKAGGSWQRIIGGHQAVAGHVFFEANPRVQGATLFVQDAGRTVGIVKAFRNAPIGLGRFGLTRWLAVRASIKDPG